MSRCPYRSSIIKIFAGTDAVPVPGGGDLENELLEKNNISKSTVTTFLIIVPLFLTVLRLVYLYIYYW